MSLSMTAKLRQVVRADRMLQIAPFGVRFARMQVTNKRPSTNEISDAR